MTYLLPFFTAFILFICFVQEQPLHKIHSFLMKKIEAVISFTEGKLSEKIAVYWVINKIFRLMFKAFGGCALCFAGHIGIWALIAVYFIKIYTGHFHIVFTGYWLMKEIGNFILLVSYNAVAAVFLFRQCLTVPSQQPKVMNVPTKKKTE